MKIPRKLDLAHLPTPLQKVNFRNTSFYIKRDDLTGLEMSGNKIRKLEFLLKDALRYGADTIFTTGGEQSNHSRATLIAASKLGLKSRLYLWGKDKANPEGNLFLDKLLKPEIKFVKKKEFLNISRIMKEDKNQLEKRGRKVYIIPEGGSSKLGIWGYIDFYNELESQLNLKKISGIVSAAGSGGTAAGLMIGSALKNVEHDIYVVNVLYEKKIITERILNLAEECIRKYRLPVKLNSHRLKVISGYQGKGYKFSTKESIVLSKDFFRKNTILFDPVYTGKAFHAYYENFLEGKARTNIMFLHTGGLFGVFAKRKDYY